MRAARRDRTDRRHRVRVGDQALRAEVRGSSQRRRRRVDRDHPSPEGGGDHHCREADSAAAVDRDPLSWPNLCLRGERVERGGEPAAEHAGGDVVQLVGEPDQVEVGGADRDLLSERAGLGESRLGLIGTHLSLPRSAPFAAPTAHDERHCDPLSDGEP